MTVLFGLLSTARINEQVLAGARGSDLVEVVGVASRGSARAEAYACEYGIEDALGEARATESLYRSAEAAAPVTP